MTATVIDTPLRLRNATLSNRIVKAALSERLATPDGVPTEELVNLYERWAEGGSGLLLSGNIMIEHGAIAETGNAVAGDRKHLDAFRCWARATGSTPLWAQINHPGRQVARTVTKQPVAPSAVPLKGTLGAFARPRALRDGEIRAIIDRFAQSAAFLVEAGFDGIQIHGAHGYLVSQFLSPLTNLRDDAWGGDRQRRRRFVVELVRAIRDAIGPDVPLGIKLNSADFQRGGFTEDESAEVVQVLAAEGIDLLEISGGTYEANAMLGDHHNKRESTKRREAYFLDYAERVRGLVDTPLMVTGGFRSRAGMNDALATGALDLVGLGRPLCVEPDLPARLLSGAADAATPIDLGRPVHKKFDNLAQMTFYQVQLYRMGRSLEPLPSITRLSAIGRYLLHDPSGHRSLTTRPTTSAPPRAAAVGG